MGLSAAGGVLVLTFGAALFLFASLHNTKKDISRSLQIQFSVFQNDMERYFDQLAVMGVNLSEDMSAEVDIKDRTLRFHNKNIYDKLGVSSLKQLQQFVAILNSGSGSTPDESGPKKAR